MPSAGRRQPQTHKGGGNSRGRILGARLGINPNSSGHGVLWAALLFLPTALVSLLMVAVTGGRLDRALERYRSEEASESVPPWHAGLVVATWGLAWAVFGLSWSAFIASIATTWSAVPSLDHLLVAAVIAAAVGLPLASLAYRRRHNAVLRQVSLLCAVVALVGLAALGFMYVTWFRVAFGSLTGAEVLLIGGFLLFTPMALLMSVFILRAAGVITSWGKAVGAAGVYLFLGLLFILPFPPLPAASYNPIGLFFPFWVIGAPAAAAAYGLRRLGRCGIEDPEDPV